MSALLAALRRQAEAGAGSRQRRFSRVNSVKLIRLSYSLSCGKVVTTYDLVSWAVLGNHLAVSDFVHPNDNLEARQERAFFVIGRSEIGHNDAEFRNCETNRKLTK
jgi:hypothetical protein